MGSHMDSVYGGGWLDGCFGVLAGLEVLRGLVERYGDNPPITVRLVDWVDEEGARFGRSLLGSSACSGTLDYAEILDLTDADGEPLREALLKNGVVLEKMKESNAQLRDIAAYVETHVQQGPVLEGLGLPLGVVVGAMGAVRHRLVFKRHFGHPSGSPFPLRRDALYAGARFIVEAQAIAKKHGGLSSVGLCRPYPGKTKRQSTSTTRPKGDRCSSTRPLDRCRAGRRIATLCDKFGVLMAPHNPLGQIATMVNIHLGFAIPLSGK